MVAHGTGKIQMKSRYLCRWTCSHEDHNFLVDVIQHSEGIYEWDNVSTTRINQHTPAISWSILMCGVYTDVWYLFWMVYTIPLLALLAVVIVC